MSNHQPTTFIAITPTMRQLIENVVEDLMLLLDEIDGDGDIEGDTSLQFSPQTLHHDDDL